MRKLVTEQCGLTNIRYMTYEQLLILIAYECGEYAIEEFLKTRYKFPILHDDFEKEGKNE